MGQNRATEVLSSWYKGLINIVGSNQVLDSTLRTLQDGAGNDLPMEVSTKSINIITNKAKFRYLDALHSQLAIIDDNFRVLYGANGNPIGVFRRIPRTLYTHANGFAETSTPHPAFLVNGSYADEIWVACYQLSVEDGSGNLLTDTAPTSSDGISPARTGSHTNVARSYPNVDPFVKGDWDYCKLAADNLNTGGITGFHMITDQEWSLIALMEKEHRDNGGAWAPGNCDHGRDVDRKDICGIISESGQVADGSHPSRIKCGSMSRANFLGIYDLKGNVWEWTLGLKINAGVAYVLPNTNTGGTSPGNSFEAAEADWYNTGINIISGLTSGNRILTKRTDIAGLLLAATSDGTGTASFDYAGYWFNASGERMSLRGACWYYGVQAAVAALSLSNARSDRGWSISSRLVFIGDLNSVT